MSWCLCIISRTLPLIPSTLSRPRLSLLFFFFFASHLLYLEQVIVFKASEEKAYNYKSKGCLELGQMLMRGYTCERQHHEASIHAAFLLPSSRSRAASPHVTSSHARRARLHLALKANDFTMHCEPLCG